MSTLEHTRKPRAPEPEQPKQTPRDERAVEQPALSRELALAPPPAPAAAGAPLDPSTRRRLERGFGEPLGDVRVHAGGDGARTAARVSARAVAVGRDVYFAGGEYRPGTLQGDALIAHELAHVLQQRGAAATTASPPAREVERHATHAAAAALVPGAVAAPPRLRTPLGLRRCSSERTGSGGAFFESAPTTVSGPFEAGNVPGQRPSMTIIAGNGTEFRFDGDGDGMKELLGRLRPTSHWQNGGVRGVQFELTQLSSGTVRTVAFEVPQQPYGFDLFPIMSEFTDGRRPTRIQLVGETLAQDILFYPPQRTPTETTYRVELSSGTGYRDQPPVVGQSQTFAFPLEATPLRPVWQPDPPLHVGDIWAVDTTAGPYGDRFRLSFRKADPAAAAATFAISVLTDSGPSGGRRGDVSVPGPLSVRIIPTDGVRLSLDLNGDGREDLAVFDRVYEPSGDMHGGPSEDRSHDILVTGPALATDATFGFSVARGLIIAGGTSPRPEDEAAAGAAAAVTGLQGEQNVGAVTDQRGRVAGEIDDIDLRLTGLRTQAHAAHMISDRLFTAWDVFARDLLVLAPEIAAARIDVGHQTAALTHARAFYDALAAETAAETHTVATRVGAFRSNVYTGEGGLIQANMISPGDRLVAAITWQRWHEMTREYRALADGMDRWIVERYRQTVTPDLMRSETLVGAQTQQLLGLRRNLDEIRGNNPTRIAAVLQPHAAYMETGRAAQLPLSLYYWRDDGHWHLRDVTDSDGPHETGAATADQHEPPVEMFRSLAESSHYPAGTIYYVLPSGTAGRLSPTGPGRWRRWVTYIGLAAGAIGLGLITAGAGTVAVMTAFAISAAAGATMAAVDLVERYRHGNLTAATAILDTATIIASISGMAAMRLGVLAQAAGRTAVEAAAAGAPLAEQSELVLQWAAAQARVVPLAAVNVAADAVTLGVMLPQAAAEYDAIDQSGAPEEERHRAKVMLLGQLALTGGLAALSVRGSVREITLGRSLNVIVESGMPVLLPVGRSFVGEQVTTQRPTADAATSESSFRASAAAQVQGIRARLPGPGGEALAEVEQQALRTTWRGEETRRVLEPIFRDVSPLAATDASLRTPLRRLSTDVVNTMNNPSLTAAQKQAELLRLLSAFESAHPQLRGRVDFPASRAAASSVGGASGEGVYVVDRQGHLTAGAGGRDAGTLQQLLDRIVQANNVNIFHGIDTEYVPVIRSPDASGLAEVQILTRPRGTGAAPTALPPQIPGTPGAAGRFVVDIGAGESAFALDMVPPAERAGTVVVQTEMPGTFADPVQARRGLGIANVAPRGDRGSVLVLSDALQNLELLFGTPQNGQGVRRLFLNNINAHYSPQQYEALGRGLGRVMGRGGRVEIQWDLSPERTGDPLGSRGHIDGPTLRSAVQQYSGRSTHYDGSQQPVPYQYSIQPSRRIGGATDPNPPTPPDPTGPHGGRAIITFE